jgi:hypothetical protein
VTEGRRGASGDHERRTEALVVNDRVEEIYGQGEVSYRPAAVEPVTAVFAPAVLMVLQRVVAAAGGQAERSGSGEVSKSWW